MAPQTQILFVLLVTTATTKTTTTTQLTNTTVLSTNTYKEHIFIVQLCDSESDF